MRTKLLNDREKQLAFFTQDEGGESINVNFKHYIHGLRLFLDKPPDESMDDFKERFKKAFSIITTSDDPQLPKEEEQDQVEVSADTTLIENYY